jgi:hypothetical protein
MYSEVRVTATQLMSRSITNAVEGNLQILHYDPTGAKLLN